MNKAYYCSCGLALKSRAKGGKWSRIAERNILTLRQQHGAVGHHEVTAKQAAAARRKVEKEETS